MPATARQPGNSSRHGFTLTELVVAASLLMVLMATIAPLTVHSGRLAQDTRRRQLAIDELSNQLEWLVSLGPPQRERAIAELVPSPHLQAALPEASVTAEIIRDSDGSRISVSLRYGSPSQPRPQRVTLVAWLNPLPGGIQEDAP